jgi:hypothetical protein
MAKAKDSGGDHARVEALLAEAGLTMPPMPAMAETRLKEREDGCFSTRAFKESPAELLHYVRKAIGGASPDYALLALGNDGRTADALHFFLVQSPLQLFLQIGRGGTGAAQALATTLINDCFALAHRLVDAAPRAVKSGRLLSTGRLTVVGSDLGESFWEVAQADERAERPTGPARGKKRDSRGPREVLEEALRWCGG